MSQKQYNVKTYYEDADYKVSLEELDDELFVHVQFFHVTRPILHSALKVWAEIKAKCYWLGYEHIYAYTKDERMTKFFPGSTVAGEYTNHGVNYKVLSWELN